MGIMVLEVHNRTNTGRGESRRLRKKGFIPAVVYGVGDAHSVYVNHKAFRKLFSGHISESTVVSLDIEGTKKEVLVKEYDENIITRTIEHIDFFEIEKGKELRAQVSIVLQGSPKGVREGGILEHFLYEIEVSSLPETLPEHIELDVSNVEIGQSLHVSHLPTIEGVKYLNTSDQVILSVIAPRSAVETSSESEQDSEAEHEQGDEG